MTQGLSNGTLDLGSRRWTHGSRMTASVLECLYKSFGWTLINSEYTPLCSFILYSYPGLSTRGTAHGDVALGQRVTGTDLMK